MQYHTQIHIQKDIQGYRIFCSISQTAQLFPRKQQISNMEFRLNGEIFADVLFGNQLSKDPIIGVHLASGKPGDLISVDWVDVNRNRGTARSCIAI